MKLSQNKSKILIFVDSTLNMELSTDYRTRFRHGHAHMDPFRGQQNLRRGRATEVLRALFLILKGWQFFKYPGIDK